MADLPDLNTSNVGYLAYWNIDSDGNVNLDNFDPEDALSATRLDNYTTYDNGWEGELYQNSYSQGFDADRPLVNIRVKTDGWFVCYIDRTNNFQRDAKDAGVGNTQSNFQGYWKLHDGFQVKSYQGDTSTSPPPEPVSKHAFAAAINHVQNELPNTTSWDYSDVGLYNYEYSGATNSTGMSGSGWDTNQAGFVVASGTDVKFRAICGCCAGGGSDSAEVTWEGTTIAYHSANDKRSFGSYDPGLLSEGTEYTHTSVNGKTSEIYSVTFIWA